MSRMLGLSMLFFIFSNVALAQWELQSTAPNGAAGDASLRGISAVSAKIAWASGSKGTVLRTLDGGKHWEKLTVPGAESLDFRDIQAFGGRTAFILAAGPGEQSRIYKTEDGGSHWQLQFTNAEPKAFYDCFAFWDHEHGIAWSDPVNDRFLLLFTSDGSAWKPLVPDILLPALPGEGGFAASGTCLIAQGKEDAWFVTGGSAARVFHSANRGRTWSVVKAPLVSGKPSQGIFSIAFRDNKHGILVGGDYQDPKAASGNAALTEDGGETWKPAEKGPSGYRSAVAFIGGASSLTAIAVGTSGSDYSVDGGKTWQPLDQNEYNAFSPAGRTGWAVGPHGRIARLTKVPAK
ncbi:MAG TPA: hypothetical protein VKZ53_10180 [Candidatus Angelobacter sp.]|nr:hypothetical protein [Candidatus Angelobacter sp.]